MDLVSKDFGPCKLASSCIVFIVIFHDNEWDESENLNFDYIELILTHSIHLINSHKVITPESWVKCSIEINEVLLSFEASINPKTIDVANDVSL